jgi:glycosyltransferase involved in cell wall biosynthesis
MALGFSSGDAIGNQMSRMRTLFREWGYDSQVYAPMRDQRIPDAGLPPSDYSSDPDNVLVYHYSAYSSLNDLVLGLPDKVVFYYHNVTPPDFFRLYDPDLAARLARGRREAARFRDCFRAWTVSEYNAQDMLEMGFKHVTVTPLFIYVDELLSAAQSNGARQIAERYADGWVNWLFVGRLAPNKRQDDIIRAFVYYHRNVNPHSRLFLVGSDAGLPAYRFELEVMAARTVPEHIHLPGAVSFEALAGYYRAASVFVSMSEHEGFGIPLVEAMNFDIPIVAFKAAAVPGTLGGAGVLVNDKHYDVIAEMVDFLTRDQYLRGRIVQKQRDRLRELAPQKAEVALRAAVRSLEAVGGNV